MALRDVAEAIFRETEKTPAAHVARLLGGTGAHRVAPTSQLDTVLDEMVRERVDAVLVVAGDDLVGIFTTTDACRVLSSR